MRNLKFHPLFVIYVFICLYFGWLNNIFFYVVSVVLHEYGHMFMAKSLGYETGGILFHLYGAGLKTNNIYKKKDDILISIAGPIVNIILIILIICLWWIVPTTYVFTCGFLKSNMMVLIFNILPLYPLDGGRIIVACLEDKIARNKILKVNSILCFSAGMLLLIFFFISIFYGINFNLLFVGLFLSINSVINDKNIYFEKAKSFSKTIDKPCEIKIFKVNNFDKMKLLKLIKPNYYSVFIRQDKSGNTIKNEDELFQ